MRWSTPARSALPATSQAHLNRRVARHHVGTGGTAKRSCLAARKRRTGRRRACPAPPPPTADPLRRLVLRVAVIRVWSPTPPHPSPRAAPARRRFAEVGGEPVDDPVGVGEARGLVGPAHLGRGDAAQHGVDEPAGPLGREADGLADGSMVGDLGELQLVRAEAQHRAHLLVDVAGEEALDEVVARAAHARGAVDEARRAGRPIAWSSPLRAAPGQREVGRRPPPTPPGAAPSRRSPPARSRAERASRAKRAPLAHITAGMWPLPSGCTSSRPKRASPLATAFGPSTARSSVVRQTLRRLPPNVVHAPPTRTSRWISSPVRPQSISNPPPRSCAYVGSPTWGSAVPRPDASVSMSSVVPAATSVARRFRRRWCRCRWAPRPGRARRRCRGPPRRPSGTRRCVRRRAERIASSTGRTTSRAARSGC